MKKSLLTAAVFASVFTAEASLQKNLYDLRFIRADVNSDSKLTFEEFLATQTGLTRWVDAARRFDLADTDGSGDLSIVEFRNSHGGAKGPRATPYQAFILADQDGDGLLSPSEYALTQAQNRSPKLNYAAFSRRDKNGDGFLTMREFGVLVPH